MSDKMVVVLYGGVGSEREVSLKSGEALADALEANFKVQRIILEAEAIPEAIDPANSIVFPALHGGFGEDGRLQGLLEAAGIDYCGSGAEASRTCMDKDATKRIAQSFGVQVPKGLVFHGDRVPLADDLIAELGESLVIKPVDQGSSVGLYFTEHRSALGVTLSQIHSGLWLAEQRICGRELTVGLLNGKAMGVVEILSATGVYDFKAKYTPGSTEYVYPAQLGDSVTQRIQSEAEQIYAACDCRDFARIDFLLDGDEPYFLEVNTLPGLTATSLLPKSAACMGMDFEALAVQLVSGAWQRKGART